MGKKQQKNGGGVKKAHPHNHHNRVLARSTPEETMPKFLHAMCGSLDKERTTKLFATEVWEEIRMDDQPKSNAKVNSSLLEMKKVGEKSFDAVFTAHSLERLYAHEVVTALSNILRVLKDDGYLLLTAADLQAACALIAEDKLLEPAYESTAGPVAPLDILYGFRPAVAAKHTHLACHCGFTSKALVGTLAQAGFASIWMARNPQTFTLAAIATKQEHSEAFLKELAQQHFG